MGMVKGWGLAQDMVVSSVSYRHNFLVIINFESLCLNDMS